jgi:mannosyltransferase
MNMISSLKEVWLKRRNLLLWIAIGSVILIALALRIIGLGNESVWIDEAFSIALSHHSITQIIQGTAADQHPPLYYLLLHFWSGFSNNIAFIRLFSALLGTLNIIQVIVIGGKIGNAILGIGAAFLLAISPFHIWYSQEARQYMLLAVLTTAATIELWNCLHGKQRWVLYGIFSILAIYTQYFAVFIFFAHGLIVIIWSYYNKTRRILIPWIITMVVTAIVFAPWLPTAINQFLNHTMPWISEPGAGDIRDVALKLILGNGVAFFPSLLRSLAFLTLLLFAIWIGYRYVRKNQDLRRGIVFIAIWALIPFIIISFVAAFYPVFQIKQYFFILTPIMLLVVGLVVATPRPWGGLIFACLLLVNGFTTVYQQSVLTKDNWRGVANYISSNYASGDLIFGNPAASSLAIDLYSNQSIPFTGYPRGYDILTGGWAGQPLTAQSADVEMTNATRGYQRVWLVEFFPQLWDAYAYLPTWLAAHGKMIDNQSFGNIHLRLYELDQ